MCTLRIYRPARRRRRRRQRRPRPFRRPSRSAGSSRSHPAAHLWLSGIFISNDCPCSDRLVLKCIFPVFALSKLDVPSPTFCWALGACCGPPLTPNAAAVCAGPARAAPRAGEPGGGPAGKPGGGPAAAAAAASAAASASLGLHVVAARRHLCGFIECEIRVYAHVPPSDTLLRYQKHVRALVF